MEEFLQVGIITSTHGIKGEVKVFPTTDDSSRFKKLKSVLIELPSGKKTLEIAGVKFFSKFVIVHFKGIDDINEVQQYVKKSLYVTRDQAVKCEKDEYFVADLIGLCVVTEDGEELGKLTDVLSTGANDVYEVTMKDQKKILLPAIKQCILNVSIQQKRVTVHLLEGLLE